jgi:xanthine dehydrogenase accessory factor
MTHSPSHPEPSGRHPLPGWDIIEQAAELARLGEEFALATVVWRQGPSSGQQGSRAIVTASGQLFGWIGGACAEPVVIREAQRAIREGETKLILLGTPEQFAGAVPAGMVVIPISCQSEGALEVFIEPAVPTPQLTIVGRSPMATTLADLATALGWRSQVFEGADFSAADLDARSIVIIATQGHGDEEAVEQAVSAYPAFVGLVASRRRAEGVLGYLADRGVPQHLLDRVHAPVGLDLGHTSHREIAVAILAELVRERAAGGLAPGGLAPVGPRATSEATEAVDPVCGMTVRADRSSHPVDHEGATYYFCCVGCRDAFVASPASYLAPGTVSQEA